MVMDRLVAGLVLFEWRVCLTAGFFGQEQGNEEQLVQVCRIVMLDTSAVYSDLEGVICLGGGSRSCNGFILSLPNGRLSRRRIRRGTIGGSDDRMA